MACDSLVSALDTSLSQSLANQRPTVDVILKAVGLRGEHAHGTGRSSYTE